MQRRNLISKDNKQTQRRHETLLANQGSLTPEAAKDVQLWCVK